MKCQFIDNDEFFEQYILDQIGEAERQAFDGHLAECKACTERLAQEEKLLAGIRQVGMADMKAEIKRQAELTTGSTQIQWGAVTRIAALAFILILTPTMYFIFKTEVQPTSAPIVFQKSLEKDISSSESEFSDEAMQTPAEGEIAEIETAKDTRSGATFYTMDLEKSNAKQNIVKSQQSRQAPDTRLRLQKSTGLKQEANITQKSTDLLEGAKDAPLPEAVDLAVMDEEPAAPPENELEPELLSNMPSAITQTPKADHAKKVKPTTPQSKLVDLDTIEGTDSLSINTAEVVVVSEAPNIQPDKKPAAELESMSGAAVLSDKENSESARSDFRTRSISKSSSVFARKIKLGDEEVLLRFTIRKDDSSNKATDWPKKFKVLAARPISDRIAIAGFLPENFTVSNEDFSVKGISKDEIEIHFGNQASYRIIIRNTSTVAIRIK